MPSTTTNSTRQHHSVRSRVRGWRPLAKASAAVGVPGPRCVCRARGA
jgi:hypothetical protein